MATTEAPLLEMRGISKHFPGVHALDDVSLTAGAGEVLALVGENGAGKSTLIKILAGAQQPDAGEILIEGERARIGSPADAERYGIVTVYQEFNLFPALSVAENLLFGHYPKNGPAIDWRECRNEARRFLAEMQVHLDPDQPVIELSIAEKQMLEIAKALHRSVRIMILDEPTAVLGGRDVDELMRVVRSLRDHGVGVIFISHRLDEIFGLAERYVVLKDGRRVDTGAVGDVDHNYIVSKMVGREFDELPEHARGDASTDEVLRVESLTRAGELEDISLSLHRGEVVGIAGLRGAGRTELARAIFGADRIDGGRVFVNGRKVKIKSPRDAIRYGIGLVPEDRATQGLLKNFSTAQNIPLARLAAAARRLISPRRERRLADRYVRELNIRVADVASLVGMLSGGNQQKVVLAKWLEAGPSVLILDEPTRGIDVGSKREIYEIVRRLCDGGMGVVVISSELPEVLQISDRILVMHQGRIAAELDGAEASEELVMVHAVGGNPELN